MSSATAPLVQSTRSKARDPRTVELSARSDGSYGALSSNGVDIYTVRVFPVLSCTCLGFQSRQTCCHSLAAQRYGRPCDWCQRLGDVTVYANHNDRDGAELALCGPCLGGK